MSPKQRFQVVLEPEQLEALRAIQDRVGAPISTQIRKAIDIYLRREQAVLSMAELKTILDGKSKAAPRRASTRRKA